MAEPEITAFLSHLASEGKVAASTQSQALSALLFLYKEVLKQEVGWLEGVERAKKPVRLPVVLAREEARAQPTWCGGAKSAGFRVKFQGEVSACIRSAQITNH